MNTARLLLPSVLLLYFLWRSLRQRVFLLGLPFLMDMYYSIFFDGLKPFWVPGTWGLVTSLTGLRLPWPATNMMIWLLITWIVYFELLLPGRRRSVRGRRLFGPRLSAPEEIVLVGFAAYMLFKVATTAVQHMDLGSAISEASVALYAFAGYFLLRGILSHAGRKETVDFLAAIVVVNTIAAGLYVLHQGLHVDNVYVGVAEYQTLVFNGEVLTRSFYFMPQFITLAIAFCAAKRVWNLFWVGVLAINLAAVWVSYTRALVLVALLEIGLILSVRLLRQRDVWPALKRVLQITVVLAVFAVTAATLMPTQSAYLLSRIAETSSRGSATADGNLQVRLGWWRTTYDWVGADNRLLGVGFPTADQDARVTRIGVMAPDLVWVPTLWNLGLLGVAILTGLFAAYAWRAGRMSFASVDDEAALISMIVLGVVVATFLLGFVQWTVFDPWHTPYALWFFALLIAERCRQRAEASQSVRSVGQMTGVVETGAR